MIGRVFHVVSLNDDYFVKGMKAVKFEAVPNNLVNKGGED